GDVAPGQIRRVVRVLIVAFLERLPVGGVEAETDVLERRVVEEVILRRGVRDPGANEVHRDHHQDKRCPARQSSMPNESNRHKRNWTRRTALVKRPPVDGAGLRAGSAIDSLMTSPCTLT